MKIKIYKDKRQTNIINEPNFKGVRKEMFVAKFADLRGFGYTEKQATDNLKKLLKVYGIK